MSAESTLKSRITEEMKDAMRAQDKARLGAIRLILAAIKQKEVDERITLTDEHVLGILEKMVKQRRDSKSQYEAAGRQDLADQENFEIQVIQTYLPTALTEAEINALIQACIKELNANSVQDMGKVMAALKPKIQGRADAGMVSAKVKQFLAQQS